MKKLSLTEFLNSEHSTFSDGKPWSIENIQSFLTDNEHLGDCSQQSQPCLLCTLHSMLEAYEKYCRENKFIQ